MDSLADTYWDVLICGTGLDHALSRSRNAILHLDSNDYYGGADAALSLPEAAAWAARYAAPTVGDAAVAAPHFSSARFSPSTLTATAISAAARAYALPLAPQIIHTRSALLAQLVATRAAPQVEFLAVGAFHVYANGGSSGRLVRVPSTREDVFASRDLAPRAKRALIKFLRFALQDAAPDPPAAAAADSDDGLSLQRLLETEFGLDADLRAAVVALTLAPDGRVSVRDGLAAVRRHLLSVGLLGPGFAAVYPKWGGGAELAQVACRACAVGGGVYVLGVDPQPAAHQPLDNPIRVQLGPPSHVTIPTRLLVQAGAIPRPAAETVLMSRLIAVVDAPLTALFEPPVEGAPTPAVAVVAVPAGSRIGPDDAVTAFPIYVLVHSSETGECPRGQSILYLSTPHTASPVSSTVLLERAADAVLAAIASSPAAPASIICHLSYDQRCSTPGARARCDGRHFDFPPPPAELILDDGRLDIVRQAWDFIQADRRQAAAEEGREEDGVEYMQFPERNSVGGNHHDDEYEEE